jgi:hypothetical protein
MNAAARANADEQWSGARRSCRFTIGWQGGVDRAANLPLASDIEAA